MERVKTSSSLSDRPSVNRRDSWAAVQKELSPLTRRYSKSKPYHEDDWLVEQRLKVNFYLDDGQLTSF